MAKVKKPGVGKLDSNLTSVPSDAVPADDAVGVGAAGGKIVLDFKALAPSLTEQLKNQGVNLKHNEYIEGFQIDVNCIVRLRERELLSDDEVAKVRAEVEGRVNRFLERALG